MRGGTFTKQQKTSSSTHR